MYALIYIQPHFTNLHIVEGNSITSLHTRHPLLIISTPKHATICIFYVGLCIFHLCMYVHTYVFVHVMASSYVKAGNTEIWAFILFDIIDVTYVGVIN